MKTYRDNPQSEQNQEGSADISRYVGALKLQRAMSNKQTIKTWVERNDQEIELEVTFDVFEGCRGTRDEYGQPLEPDEEPSCEIIEILPDMELTEPEEERAEAELWKTLFRKEQERIEGIAERREEEARERKHHGADYLD